VKVKTRQIQLPYIFQSRY